VLAGALPLVAVAAALALSTGGAARPGGSLCPDHALVQPAGSVVGQAVTVPPDYDGDEYRPADTQAYPGKRPGVVVMHGGGGTKCSLTWAARFLAAHGYVTLTVTDPKSDEDAVDRHVEATRKAIKYLRSHANPFAPYIDRDNLGLTGHSLGATAIVYVQGVAPKVNAIVALDNLKYFRHGDPATALHCAGAMTDPVHPRVPALGMASDFPCANDAGKTDKQFGWRKWRAADVQAVELVLRDFKHRDFGGGGTDPKLRKVAYYMRAWFDRWLLHDHSQCGRIFAKHPLGIPIAQMLSTRPSLQGHLSNAYHSAAYLPGRIVTANLVPYLQSHPPVC
jgi:hypothetical protein